MIGQVAVDTSLGDNKKRPAFVAVHDAFGIKDLLKNRLKLLASMGYLAFAGSKKETTRRGEGEKANPTLAHSHTLFHCLGNE